MAEVDAFLGPAEDERNRRRERVKEAHPEVCFVAFDGGEFEYPKRAPSDSESGFPPSKT
ncbi:DUF429 domain-containing protein [Natrinema versiforme]|uniref:DUF429 domain-containing protein n=1 Tax=Natrinema versiforme TaxID=88724 RepID=UPI00374399F1